MSPAPHPVCPRHLEPVDRPVVGPFTPFDSLVVQGEGLDQDVAPGGRAAVAVTLTSPQRVSLRVCPDYDVAIGAAGQGAGLNCAGVPYRDANGDPYLPAGVPVTFDMEVAVPPDLTGEQKLLWTLDGPQSARSRPPASTAR